MSQLMRMTIKWKGNGVARSAALFRGRPYYVGRHPDKCEILLSDPAISGQQVEIKFDQGYFYAKNIGRGQPVIALGQEMLPNQRARLAPDAIIEVGSGDHKLTLTVIDISVINAVNIVTCPRCKRPVDQEWRDCPWCGQNLAAAQTYFG